MKLENRYYVAKITDVRGALSAEDFKQFCELLGKAHNARLARKAQPLEALVLERDWPEYAPALAMLGQRVDGEQGAIRTKHSHYHKAVAHLTFVDVYRVLQLFNVTDQAIGHAIKKLLVAGGRGAGKDMSRDIQEACDSLNRWQEMQAEDVAPLKKLDEQCTVGRDRYQP